MAQVKALGLNSADANCWCCEGLQNARISIRNVPSNARSGEWADGDAVASHIAYGLDIFCSADVGNSNATSLIL